MGRDLGFSGVGILFSRSNWHGTGLHRQLFVSRQWALAHWNLCQTGCDTSAQVIWQGAEAPCLYKELIVVPTFAQIIKNLFVSPSLCMGRGLGWGKTAKELSKPQDCHLMQSPC
jgi:hypothetical protein